MRSIEDSPAPQGARARPKAKLPARGGWSLRAPREFRGARSPGADALAAWASGHKQALAAEAQRRAAGGAGADRALALVREFIAARGLVVFGGLAIDYALRLKGASIYPDGLRPDFDCYSPRSVDDAYDLVELLAAAGFERPGAVRGIHVQTMRVRAGHVWVADFGYAPRDVFDRLPTFDYQGLRVVHPDFQRMDLHLAFCFPYNAPPHEDVFHRWGKDLERFNLLEAHYPWGAAAGAAGAAPRTVECRLGAPVAGRGDAARVALHGFAAYAVIRSELDALGAALGAPVPTAAPPLALRFVDDRTLAVETPAGDAVVFASPWPEAAVAGLPGAQRFDPYMDACPEAIRAGAAVVISTQGRLLAATRVRAAPCSAGGAGAKGLWALPRADAGGDMQAFVVTPQFLLLWLALEAHRARDAADRATYRAFYAHTLDILRVAEQAFAGALELAATPPEREAVMALYLRSPFAPTVDTFGDTNHSAAYLVVMAAAAERARDSPPEALGLPADLASRLRGLPRNYRLGGPPGSAPRGRAQRPGAAQARPAFDYEACPLFRRSGGPSGPPGALVAALVAARGEAQTPPESPKRAAAPPPGASV